MKPENDPPTNEELPPTPDVPSPDHSDSLGDMSPQAPADALSRTPDDLDEEQKASEQTSVDQKTTPKKPSSLRRFFRRANLYFLFFFLVVAIGVIVTIVNYLNATKDPVLPTVGSQELTQDALQQLANTDASVGNASQTLTIQGNAIIDGQTLMRGNLNIAGNLQTGGSIQGPTLTISGATNLGDTQINSLQVATNTAIQGSTTMRDLSVAGNSTFNGPVTMSQLAVTSLILSGNATLQVPNHISFTGPTPDRTINSGPLGGGGSASVSGSDTAGTVNVSTGNSPQAGCMVRINFTQGFTKQPHVIISPIGNAAGRTQYYVDRDQAGFSICTAAPAPGNSTFAFDYFVTY